MQKSRYIMLIAALLMVGLSGAAFAEQTPGIGCPNASQEAPTSLLQWLGVESPAWLLGDQGPTLPQTHVALNCSHFNSSWCTYQYNKFTACCVVVWAAPGANCSNICA